MISSSPVLLPSVGRGWRLCSEEDAEDEDEDGALSTKSWLTMSQDCANKIGLAGSDSFMNQSPVIGHCGKPLWFSRLVEG
ncbi:hypothetical protein [Xanthomonas nasturtii]|uniref:hypothetical protein n=1 Tax=Xanthomonas nasturtii TaxID=1843581 RepID=UPI002B227609|nr:hypothetical protein [Xanthomonas nasturtii]